MSDSPKIFPVIEAFQEQIVARSKFEELIRLAKEVVNGSYSLNSNGDSFQQKLNNQWSNKMANLRKFVNKL